MKSDAILFINLGSPDSYKVGDVRKYLRQFLMDKFVIDIPYIFRAILVHLFILPFRPRRSAEAYRKIFTSEGSPLVFITEKFVKKFEKKTGMQCYMAMRYGNPSIKSIMQVMKSKGCKKITLAILYPHYATSSYESARFEALKFANQFGFETKILKPFFNHPDYLKTLADSIRPHLDETSTILFSYHGIPERQIQKIGDHTKECQFNHNCCTDAAQNSEERLNSCYRAQC